MWKTIKISESIKKKLDKLKIHPRQSYGEVIGKLIEKCPKGYFYLKDKNAKKSKV